MVQSQMWRKTRCRGDFFSDTCANNTLNKWPVSKLDTIPDAVVEIVEMACLAWRLAFHHRGVPVERAIFSALRALYGENKQMAGRRNFGWPRCSARTRAGGFCQMKVAVGENGFPQKRCRLHGCTPKTPEGLEAISIACKAFWEGYRRDKALGLPVPRVGRPKRQAGS
jgi:hypothetical protein